MIGDVQPVPPPDKKKHKHRRHFGGTRLMLRQDKPLNDALSYGDEEPGEFLGYCVGRLSVPWWMSPQFYNAMANGVDVTLYPHDWVEQIYYVPSTERAFNKASLAVLNGVVMALQNVHLAVDRGCGLAVPATVVQAVNIDSAGVVKASAPKKETFYALASGFAGKDMKKITEWTIAKQAYRSKIERSAIHKYVVSEGMKRQVDMSKDQRRLYEAILKLPEALRP